MKTDSKARSLAEAPRCCPPPDRPDPGAAALAAALMKVLGDPTRLEILQLLAAANGTLCACDIESRFDLSQPTISHHLGLLRRAGLVVAHRRGTWMHYTLATEGLAPLRALADELTRFSCEQECANVEP